MNTEPYILDLSITLLLDVAEKNIPDVFEKVFFLGREEQSKVRDIIFPKETSRALDDLYKKKWELYSLIGDIMAENGLTAVVLNRESLTFGPLFEFFRKEGGYDIFIVYNGELRLLES